MTSGVKPPDLNPLFDYFVNIDAPEGEQLQGLIAYALYKRAKREWAGGREQKPTENELEFYIDTWTKSQREALSSRAEQLLDSFASAYVEAAEPHIRAQALRGTFWAGVRQGMMAAFLYSLGLIAVAIILHYFGVDILDLLSKVRAESH